MKKLTLPLAAIIGLTLSVSAASTLYFGGDILTMEGAKAQYVESVVTEDGKIADLVVLTDNPLKVDPMKIKEIEVVETIKNGKTIYTK